MIKTGKELAAACESVAKNHKTLYVMGCIGAPLTGANVERYCNNHSYNKQTHRKEMIKTCANQNPPYYGFDCVCLIKSLLWGWNGNPAANYGGAAYASNGVPDIGADQMIAVCKEVSTDFSNIVIGEAVWMPGHIGIYIGNGKAVECTPQWGNGVQITACNRAIQGVHRRNWTKHGKLPYVEYSVENVESPSEPEKKTVDEIAREVIAGKWSSGSERKQKLTAAGYDYRAIQDRVNLLLLGPSEKKTVDEIAREVIAGKWSSGSERKQKLTAAGYDYRAIQNRVNELLK